MKRLIQLSLIFSSFCLHAQTAKDYFDKSMIEYNYKNFKKADSLISIAIQLDKKNGNQDYLKYYNRGVFRQELNFYQSAIRDFDTSLNLNPQFYPALENRAISYFCDNKYLEANSEMELCLKMNPKRIDAYILHSMINVKLRNYDKVLATCSKGLLIEKKPVLYKYQILAYVLKGDFYNAKKKLNVAKDIYGEVDDNIFQAQLYYLKFTNDESFCEKSNYYWIYFNKDRSILGDNEEFDVAFKKCVNEE